MTSGLVLIGLLSLLYARHKFDANGEGVPGFRHPSNSVFLIDGIPSAVERATVWIVTAVKCVGSAIKRPLIGIVGSV